MAKHAATRTAHATRVAAGPEGAVIAATYHGRHRAPSGLASKQPANTGTPRLLPATRPTGGTRTGEKAQTRPQTRYVGKNSLYTPRSSRTRYIRYLGNNDVSNTPKLVAEWIGGVVLICIAVPTQAANNGYRKTITKIMYRLTALTAVFFVLSLMAGTKAGKAAVYLGLLVDLGIVFDAVKSGTLRGVTNIMTGQSVMQSGNMPAADIVKPTDQPIGGGLIQELPSASAPSNEPVPA